MNKMLNKKTIILTDKELRQVWNALNYIQHMSISKTIEQMAVTKNDRREVIDSWIDETLKETQEFNDIKMKVLIALDGQ